MAARGKVALGENSAFADALRASPAVGGLGLSFAKAAKTERELLRFLALKTAHGGDKGAMLLSCSAELDAAWHIMMCVGSPPPRLLPSALAFLRKNTKTGCIR